MKNLYIFSIFFIILISVFFATKINISSKSINEFRYACQKGKTPFDVLLTKTQTIKFQDSSYGKMVTTIDNSSQGNGKYWLYSINGKEATTAANLYICEDSEEIKWELK